MKKVLFYSLTFTLMFSLFLSSLIFASNADQKELEGINGRISDVKALLNQGEKKERTLSQQISDLDKEIEAAEKEISRLQNNLKETQDSIDQTILELENTQEEIDGKNDVLNSRLRVMYKNGEVGVMEILLGSSTFQEFLTNIDMVNKIQSKMLIC